jgi:Holliday junction resolvase RusA-like endonuclease
MAKKSSRLTVDDLNKMGLVELSDGVFFKVGSLVSKSNSESLGVEVNDGKAVVSDGARRMGKKSHKEVQNEIFNEQDGGIYVKIKALSINGAFKGRRFKTPEYSRYERDVLRMLPELKLDGAPYELYLEVGFSSKLSDLDNSCKPFLDCLVKKYNFDDREIFSIIAKKKIVKKGSEYIKFNLTTIKQ